MSHYVAWGKSLSDKLIAALLLVLVAPVLVTTAAVVAVAFRERPLFVQLRTGRHGRPFACYKLRTMRTLRDARGQLLADADRLTRPGRWLRTTSLDELPQLWNVLRGEMSLVGPRPLPTAYLPAYSHVQRRRHHVRPGITGLAQVRGRNGLAWSHRFRYDVFYGAHVSAALDAMIWRQTLRQVVRPAGIRSPGHATGAPFVEIAGAHPTRPLVI